MACEESGKDERLLKQTAAEVSFVGTYRNVLSVGDEGTTVTLNTPVLVQINGALT